MVTILDHVVGFSLESQHEVQTCGLKLREKNPEAREEFGQNGPN